MNSALPAAEEYRDRVERTREEAWRQARRLRTLVRSKRWVLFAVIGYAVFDPTVVVVLVPLALSLIPITILQAHMSRRLHQRRLAVAHFERVLLRIDGGWIGDGDSGEQYRRDDDLFADDLDVFGRGSLFHFLSTARTEVGYRRLAEWLQEPTKPDLIRERQNSIRELSGEIDFQACLASVSLERSKFKPQAVLRGAEAPILFPDPFSRILGAAIAYALVVTTAAWLFFGISELLLIGVAAIELSFYFCFRHSVLRASRDVYYATLTINFLARVGAALPQRSFQSPQLSAICASFSTGRSAPFRRLLSAYGVVGQFPLLFSLLCQAFPAAERWRIRIGGEAVRRLNYLGELEALASLSQYAFEQGDGVFPEIVCDDVVLEATALGHPLIDAGQRVTNDVKLGGDLRLLLVSGSNMSGKSTMLRTIGINAVLALAGAPVYAAKMRISPFAIGTAMRFQDSLERRTSHFFAVIERLGAVMELLKDGQRPLLFLIDEILQGTNSHDRLLGAEALLAKLVDGGAIGLATTHDLELTNMVDRLGKRAQNVHFVDKVVDGEIRFDYLMQPGVVRTSNALLLMRKMGLDV